MEARYNVDGFVVVDYDCGDEIGEIVLYQATRAIEDLVSDLRYCTYGEEEIKCAIEEEFDYLEQDERDMIGLNDFSRLVRERLPRTRRFTTYDLRESGEGM